MVFEVKSKKLGNHMVFVDDEDWPRIKEYTWHIRREKPSTHLRVFTRTYAGANRTKELRLDQLVLRLAKMTILMDIFHRDDNPMNNRKDNLYIFGKKDGDGYEV